MKLSDIYNSICTDSSVENKNCILLKLYFTYKEYKITMKAKLFFDGCYSSKFLRSSARRFLLEILVLCTK